MRSRIPRLIVSSAVVLGVAVGGLGAPSAGALTVGPTQVFGVGGDQHDGVTNGISCTATGCVAVGSNEGIQKPLVVTGVPSAPVAAYTDADPGRHNLYDVWCADATRCVATGVADSATGNHQFITEYASGVWTRVAPVDPPDVNPVGGHGIHLRDVSCVDVDHCAAVGEYQANSGATPPNGVRGLAYSKVDGTWSVQVLEPAGSVVDNFTNPPTTRLTSVRCLTTTTCVAVGTYGIGSGSALRPYLAVGTVSGATMTWTTRELPIPDFQASVAYLDSAYLLFGSLPLLDCSSATDCTVAGTYESATSEIRNYFWSMTDGVWATEATTRSTDPSDPTVLRALACPAPSRCYAVGNTRSGAHGTVVTLQGGTPSFGVLDKPGNETNWLVTLACPTRENCVVAGNGNVPGGFLHVTVGGREAGAWSMHGSFAEAPSEVTGRIWSVNAIACQPDGTCVVGGTRGLSEYSATLTTVTLTLDPSTDDATTGPSGEPSFTG